MTEFKEIKDKMDQSLLQSIVLEINSQAILFNNLRELFLSLALKKEGNFMSKDRQKLGHFFTFISTLINLERKIEPINLNESQSFF
jgi:hypothetical protein